MDFRGHLRLPDDAGAGIPVVLRLDDIFVIITASDDELGTWRADDVAIERIFSNQFAIDLDGEPMVFVAQDALGFAYEGVTAIEDLQERLTKRGIFRRTRRKDKKSESTEVGTPSVESREEAPTEVAPTQTTRVADSSRRPAAELVSHLDPSDERVGEITTPEVQPPLPSASTPLWTPTPADHAPTQAEGRTADVDAPPAARPGSKARQDSAERPADSRVSYPRTPTPPPPAVDSFVPPQTDAPPPTPVPETVDRVGESRPAPAQPPAPESDAPPESDEQAEPVRRREPEPELEIEEVTVASSGTPWDESDSVPAAAAHREFEIEIEEYVPPTAGEVDTFVAPQGQPEPVAAQPAPEETPDPVHETQPEVQPDPVAPTRWHASADAEEDGSVESEVEHFETAARADDPAAANGHKAEKRRSFLFGRTRDKSVPAHDHAYGEPKTLGGLTRQVCGICGHVTFSGQDVYQDW